MPHLRKFRNCFCALLLLAMASVSTVARAEGMKVAQINDTAWTTEDDSISVVFKPCRENAEMLCGYLKTASPEAVKRFGLSAPPEKLGGLCIIEGLRPESGSRFSGGRFVNTQDDNVRAARVSLQHAPGASLKVVAARWIFSRTLLFKPNPY
jgi:hypothetical protein